MDFWVLLRPIRTKNIVISSKLIIRDTRISHCSVLKTILCKEVAQKLNKKLPKNNKKPQIFQFFQYLGHFEETFDQKIGNFSKNVLQT